MVSHIDRLMQPNQTYQSEGERRTTSAPNPNTTNGRAIEGGRPLPNPPNYSRKRVSERSGDYGQHLHRERANDYRMGSAPEPYNVRRNNDQELRVVNVDQRKVTARAVPPSSSPPKMPVSLLSLSPVKMPAPLNIRKVKAQPPRPAEAPMMTGALNTTNAAFTKFDQLAPNYSTETKGRESRLDGDPFKYDGVKYDGGDATLRKKTANWFKRDPKTGEDKNAVRDVEDSQNNFPGARMSDQKKKGFALGNLFKKFGSKEEEGAAIGCKLTNLPITSVTNVKQHSNYSMVMMIWNPLEMI